MLTVWLLLQTNETSTHERRKMRKDDALHRAVSVSRAVEPSRILEVAGADRLLHRNNVGGVRVALDEDLDTLAQLDELIADVADASERLQRYNGQNTEERERQGETHLDLDKVLVGPRDREAGLLPLLPDVEKHEVVSSRLDEVLTSGVGCAEGNKHQR